MEKQDTEKQDIEFELESEIVKMVLEFANKNPEIFAVFYGCSPEEGHKVLYFVVKSKEYDGGLEDKLTDFNLNIFHKTGVNVGVMCFPVDIEKIKKGETGNKCKIDGYSFTGTCIYMKQTKLE